MSRGDDASESRIKIRLEISRNEQIDGQIFFKFIFQF